MIVMLEHVADIFLDMPVQKKILHVGYLWHTVFRDYILVVQKCHACQIHNRKSHAPPTQLHPVVVVGHFSKWGMDFMTCAPHSVGGYGYIIIVVDYFTK